MKILFINLPYYGHVVPTIGLVKELIARGCEVTYILPFDWESQIEGSGAKFCGYKNHKQLSEQMKNAYRAAETVIDSFDLVIYEQFFFLGKHLAAKYNKPSVRVFTAPATNKELMVEFISKGPMSIFKHKWISRAFTKDITKGIQLKSDDWLDEIVLNPPKLNLVYTLREYQPYADDFPDESYKFLGPSVYERRSETFDFVKGNRTIVYVSLGTVLRGALSFFQGCIDAFRDEDVDVIISVGKDVNIARLKNVPTNVHIYNSVPQIEVLRMADAFVTHGGMNSVSEAMTYGVPMVVIPFVSDQPVNARCVERIGIGKKLDYSEADKISIKNAVFSIIADSEVTDNIKRVQGLIESAPGNKGGAEMIVKYYNETADNIKKK